MKVSELISKLKKYDQGAYVHIQTDERFEEDITDIYSYSNEDADVVVLKRAGGWVNI